MTFGIEALVSNHFAKRKSTMDGGLSEVQTAQSDESSFYKRPLPPPAVTFSSAEGMELFREAMADGAMFGFFKLVEQFHTQANPGFCGLASLAMVLNTLSIDPKRMWKTPWRWFDETLLDCCKPLDLVEQEGINIVQVACLARCNGAKATVYYPRTSSVEEFRVFVENCCRKAEEHLIVNYCRSLLQQTGTGHFSPIGGYHAKRDLVLILDTARFKYPPHWLPLELLYKAMAAVDPSTQSTRGFMIISAQENPVSIQYTLNLRGEWKKAEEFIRIGVPTIVNDLATKSVSADEVMQQLVQKCPWPNVRDFITLKTEVCSCGHGTDPTLVSSLMTQLHALSLYQEVAKNVLVEESKEAVAERITILLLLRTAEEWSVDGLQTDVQRYLLQLTDLTGSALVDEEMTFLRYQWQNLVASGDLQKLEGHHCCCATTATN